eukprot:scaffold46464_cov199-Amphora_coffeaeformis.AAC.7
MPLGTQIQWQCVCQYCRKDRGRQIDQTTPQGSQTIKLTQIGHEFPGKDWTGYKLHNSYGHRTPWLCRVGCCVGESRSGRAHNKVLEQQDSHVLGSFRIGKADLISEWVFPRPCVGYSIEQQIPTPSDKKGTRQVQSEAYMGFDILP